MKHRGVRRGRAACLIGLLVAAVFVSTGSARAATAATTPTLSAGADAVVGEADGHVDVTVTLSAISASTVTVNYATASGSAGVNDFTGVSGMLSFAPGETTKAVPVTITDDGTAEDLESFTFNLSNAIDATIARASEQICIVDNDTVDASPLIYVRDATVDESAGTVDVPVLLGGTRGHASASTVSVDYTTANGTAKAPGDYSSVSGTLTFDPGKTVGHVIVPIVNDSATEGAEWFFVALSNPVNGVIAQGSGRVVIGPNDQTALRTPTLSVQRDTVIGEGDGYVDVAVTTSAPSTKSVSVSYTTTSRSAGVNDFLATSGTLHFAPGETTKTVRVEIYDDATVEDFELFTLDLSGPVNATIARASGSISIIDNDTIAAKPLLYVRDATVDESAGTVDVPVLLGGTRGHSSISVITVKYATVDGTASPGADYTKASGTLTFGPGQTVQHVIVPITDDSVSEGAEWFFVTLTHPVNASISQRVGRVTIGASDAAAVASPTLSVQPDAVVGEGDGYVDVAVTTNAPSAGPVSVSYTTTSRSAGVNDFLATSGTLHFAPGETTKTVRVEIYDDATVEDFELFTLDLSNAVSSTIARASGSVSIIDNDSVVPKPALTIRDATVDESAGTVDVAVLLGGSHGQASGSVVTVQYATADSSAIAGSDYTATQGTLTFGPGQTVQHVIVPIDDDATQESAEQFSVKLSHPVRATISDGKGVVTIGANDAPAVAKPAVSVAAKASVHEGDGYIDIVVSLKAPGEAAASVAFATASGTAGVNDFLATSGTLNFAPGETTKTVRVEIYDDTAVEGNETFTLNLSAPGGLKITRTTCTITIVDDD